MRRQRRCPKCGGNVIPERQVDGGIEFCCLQCGRLLTRQEVLARFPASGTGATPEPAAAVAPPWQQWLAR